MPAGSAVWNGRHTFAVCSPMRYHPTTWPPPSYGHRCEAATTSMVSGRCTPPTTARTVARFTIGGPVPLGPGVSTRPTQKFAWTCPSADDRNIGL